mgnify:CR=1 FL=1
MQHDAQINWNGQVVDRQWFVRINVIDSCEGLPIRKTVNINVSSKPDAVLLADIINHTPNRNVARMLVQLRRSRHLKNDT